MNPSHDDEDLLAGLRGLPSRREPPAAVWQRIEASLDAGAAPVTAAAALPMIGAHRRRWRLPVSLAAAASLAALAVMLLPAQLHQPPSPTASQPQAPLLQQADAMSGEYRQAIAALPAAPVPAELRPALQELDASATQIRDALHQQPDAGYLLGQLRRTYDKRLELTRMVALNGAASPT